ncbi:hypothetical protein K4K61_006781 [Colletotrichum sp. SAR11_59]|nr:hypothetical protein K4K61_006781 [Colletotrichum sp. SAR11_59]
MAEVLGVVSSAIAVAELAGKFGLSVMKLKQLWDEIQDIPEEMNRIMRQLEILKPVLAGMEADFVQRRHKVYFNSATNLQASIEYCRDAVNDLENLAEDLQARISTAKRSRRNITKLKVSFKKEDIRKYQERIGWALHLISLSQQSYMMAFMKSQTVMELVQDPEPSLLDTVVDDSHEVQTDCTKFAYSSRHGYLRESLTCRHIVQIYGELLDVEKALAAGEASLFDRGRYGGTMLHKQMITAIQ